ncbi:hypothetical protein EG68_00583 [Paragonimus skrjabini miyazakii]|uniref:Ig-like domain-containing protein n=1 Tax=Paragonimus skrjabini miyazakii TaxID=59628 RepID=A0A8S9ZCB3_9TREM|nr:hypothetical protein EG68_00583 [Paragonimus skrjabini miyazakii]
MKKKQTALPSVVLTCLLLWTRIPCLCAVRGCVTYVAGEDYSMRQSICDKPDTHFKSIPSALPSQVVKLTINHQEIGLLNASQFNHLPNLSYLDLDSNKLSIIKPDTFQQLRKLRTLSLRFNLLSFTTESFHPNAIIGLAQLENLNLLQNPIALVPRRLFAPIGSTLRSLVLASASEDFELDREALANLTMLQILDLSSNHLETLSEDFELSLNSMQLRELYLYDNPWRCDCHLRWLKVWFLKHNDKMTFSKPVPEGISRKLLEPSMQIWSGSNSNGADDTIAVLQPKCATPYALSGKPLFSHQSSTGLQPVRTTDFHCAPNALTPSQPIHFPRGGNATLSCEFFADPTGIVVWYRNGTRVQNHWPRMSIHQSQGRNFYSELTIQNIQSEDAGNYDCFLDTGHGRVNSTFTVHIETEEHSFAYIMSGSVLQWMSGLNANLVLKYTGITASCLVILLMLIGLLIYCFYGRNLCGKKRRQLSSAPRVEEKKYSAISRRVSLVTDKSNGFQSGKDDNCLGMDKSARNVCPNSVAKPSFTSSVNNAFTPPEQMTTLRLLPSTEKLNNYVAFRIVPQDIKAENQQGCSVHNYAIIQSVASDAIIVQQADDDAEPTVVVNPETLPSIAQIEQAYAPRLMGVVSGSNVTPLNTENETQIDEYSPCPLHGNIYATLHPKSIRVKRNSLQKHIATVPPGIGSFHEKWNHTLPSSKKSQTNGQDQFNKCDIKNPVSTSTLSSSIT